MAYREILAGWDYPRLRDSSKQTALLDGRTRAVKRPAAYPGRARRFAGPEGKGLGMPRAWSLRLEDQRPAPLVPTEFPVGD